MLATLLLLCCAALPRAAAGVPSVASLAPPARTAWRLLGQPQVQNFWAAAGLRRDLVSLGTLAFTPLNGNYQNSSLAIDGAPGVLDSSRWGVCTGERTGAAGGVAVANEVRLPFESRAALQEWALTPGDGAAHALSIGADGPFFRACDAPGGGACGWGTTFPVDRASFAASLTRAGSRQVMLTVDATTGAAAASAVWWRSGGVGDVAATVVPVNSTFALAATFSGPAVLRQAFAAGADAAAAVAALTPLLDDGSFDAAWAGACDAFEARWQSAFMPPAADGGAGTHFSGSLPILTSDAPELDRLYYWAALAMVSLERTNLRSGPRQYVISQGPSNSFDGSAGMGGSGQFIWDLSFASTAMALLDPEAMRDTADFVMNQSASVAAGELIAVPQSWDAFPAYGQSPAPVSRSTAGRERAARAACALCRARVSHPPPHTTSAHIVQAGSYRFDYYSAFLYTYTYVSINNASSFLTPPRAAGRTASGHAFLRALSDARTGYPASPVSPWLADYGSNKRDYLEVVPSYVGVVPALQAGAAGMSLALARLVEQSGPGVYANASALAAELRANASAIVAEAARWLWRGEDAGAWRCMYNDSSTAAVRSINDYVYVAQALGLLGRGAAAGLLPADVANASTAFFARELLPPGAAWVRALSLADPLCANYASLQPSIEDKLVYRSDWGCGGSYGGIPGFATESAAHLTGDLAGTLAALRQLAPVAAATAPSQGIAVDTPPYLAANYNGGRAPGDVPPPPYGTAWPEFFDEPDFPSVWPDTERFVQNAEASIVDAVVRTLFGWRPDWTTPAAPPRSPAAAAAIDAALFLPRQPRAGFNGTLALLRTPLGYINITASSSGLEWVWA